LKWLASEASPVEQQAAARGLVVNLARAFQVTFIDAICLFFLSGHDSNFVFLSSIHASLMSINHVFHHYLLLFANSLVPAGKHSPAACRRNFLLCKRQQPQQ